eukprot:scaffold74933_cov54-Phaeocystis_antarctica.AAC.1
MAAKAVPSTAIAAVTVPTLPAPAAIKASKASSDSSSGSGRAGTASCLVSSCPSLALPSWSPQSTPSTTAPMLAFQAFHLAAYHFAHGTFQPTATSSA